MRPEGRGNVIQLRDNTQGKVNARGAAEEY